MSKSYSTRVALRVFIAGILCCSVSLSAATAAGQTKMATFDSAGETNFALSVKADFQGRPSRATDVVIYVDTSASQTGVFREDSIRSLETLLSNLSADDRVKLVAVDLDPVPLTNQFVSADSREITNAIERLRQRTPLGSTDMKQMLKSAPAEFESEATRNKNIVYIGDGISRGGIVHPDALEESISRLVRHHISVSSFAIGPDRNVELLAILANHTGGNLFVDSDQTGSPENAAVALADTVHGSVFWPRSPKFSDSVIETFPTAFPPLRDDRDSIILGTIANGADVHVSMTGKTNGKPDSAEYTIRPEGSNNVYSFLPRMLRDARKDGGLTLPTAGSSGLMEYARVLGFKSRAIAELSKQAMDQGDQLSAQRLATAAMALDPQNRAAAQVIAKSASYRPATQDGGLFGDGPVEAETPSASPFDDGPAEAGALPEMGGDSSPFDSADPEPSDLFESSDAAPSEQPVDQPAMQTTPMAEAQPVDDFDTTFDDASTIQPPEVLPVEPEPAAIRQPQPMPPMADSGFNLIGPPVVNESAIDRLMREEESTANRLILTEEQQRKVINDKIRKQVAFELKQARIELRDNPAAALERLKSMIGVLDSTTDLFPNTRQDLRNRLESALQSSSQRKLEFDENEAQLRLARATALSQQRSIAAMARKEEQLTRLVNRFNSLMDEGNFEAARSVTRKAVELAPRSPEAIVAAATAERAATAEQFRQLSELKQRNFAAAMYEVHMASVPFPANPLMQFPDAEEWKRKKLRRAKYDSIRLTGSENDEKILRALDEPATLEYDEEAWSDIEADLEAKFRINIVLTQSAKDDSLDVDEPVSADFRGIRLKNALRLMLKEKNATFIVRDEVLQIISLDDAEDAKYFVTNVYNVGDLVAPRFNPNAGLAGGLGGQGGGGQGGGGLGGGGGGGFGGGGGGLGGGGGGGVFCVQETGLTLVPEGSSRGSNAANLNPPSATSAAKTERKPTAAPAKALSLPMEIAGGQATTWSEYFSNVFADAKSVRLTVRELMKQKSSDEIVALIFAAIENDQRQDWMYEALTLTLQISGHPDSDVERALMSAVDLSSDVNDLMYAAQYMATHGMEKRALGLFEDIARAYPTRTEPVLMGLRAANRIGDVEGIRWATVGVFSHEWPDHPEVVKEAQHSSEALRLKLQESGLSEALASYEAELIDAKRRDCFVKVSWTGEADLDIVVQEPGGTLCSHLEKRTRSGGVMLGDQFSADKNASGETAEYYVLPKGFSGDYKLFVRRIWGEVTSGKVTVAVYSHYGSEDQGGEIRQLELNDPGFAVEFSLANGRRTESLEAHTIASVVDEQVNSNRSILAQQIADVSASTSLGGGSSEDLLDFDRLLFNRRRARAVGYQPQVTVLPLGPSMTVNHATTADRLYVLVSVTPQFTELIDVFTFNSAGGADDAQGGGGGL